MTNRLAAKAGRYHAPRFPAISRQAIIIVCLGLLLVFLLCGCAAKVKTTVWANADISFESYKLIEIHQVYNATDGPVEPYVFEILNRQIKEKFEATGLPINLLPEVTTGVLVVSSDILVFDPYSPVYTRNSSGPAGQGETKCNLRTRLTDKASKKVVAEVVAVKVASAGGVYTVPFGGYPKVNLHAHEKILRDVAAETVLEISRLLSATGR